MKRQTNSTLSRSTAIPEYFELREATTMTELMKLLRLRAEVFAASRWSSRFAFSPEGLELDEYDPRARHFGLFANGRHPVGYQRVIIGDSGIVEPRIFRAVEGCPELEERVSREPLAPIPMLHYGPFPEAVQKYYWAERSRRRLVEASRFAVPVERREVRLMLSVVQGCIAIMLLVSAASAVMTCHASASRTYRRCGATDLPGTRPAFHEVWNAQMCFLAISSERIPEPVRERLEPLAAEYRATGMLRFPAATVQLPQFQPQLARAS